MRWDWAHTTMPRLLMVIFNTYYTVTKTHSRTTTKKLTLNQQHFFLMENILDSNLNVTDTWLSPQNLFSPSYPVIKIKCNIWLPRSESLTSQPPLQLVVTCDKVKTKGI